ncbi:MAG: DNA mismatch repair protein MutS [Planctomycetia bacterium]|nr:DNA mismatch repair protein MutS [Planctomycetia bacterium]
MTPMMKQYLEAKAAAKDAILLFRMGDFYELFFDDAYQASNALGIAVTTRERNKGENATPMAGFPYLHLDSYLAKLISAGFKVAVCEQVEDPKKTKNIVKREVVRIVTPGTVLDETILNPRQSNYLAGLVLSFNIPKTDFIRSSVSSKNDLSSLDSLKSNNDFNANTDSLSINDPEQTADNSENDKRNQYSNKEISSSQSEVKSRKYWETIDGKLPVGLAWVDLSTGQFHAATIPFNELFDQLGRIKPSECLVPDTARGFFPEWLTETMMISERPDWIFSVSTATDTILKHFQVKTLEGFGFNDQTDSLAIRAAGAVLDYLHETQKQSLAHIETVTPYHSSDFLEMDEASRRSLEIVQTSRDNKREGSFLSVLDHCITSMGSRLLNDWIIYPLIKVPEITVRQDAVEELITRKEEVDEIRNTFRNVYDLERIMSRVVQERANVRDLVYIARTLQILPTFRLFLESTQCSLLKTLGSQIDTLQDLAKELNNALVDDPPLNYREGGFIRNGYSKKLDEYRNLQRGGKEWIIQYQAQEIKRTGISTLKVGYTSVFGYYIEVTRAQAERVPTNYVRKQTLKNAERYITEELKEYEEKVLRAEELARELEMELFVELRQKVLVVRAKLQKNAGVLAHLDVLTNLATLALTRSYQRPKVVDEPILSIIDGRHPVLDITQATGNFVPNNAFCDNENGTIHLITGPNMSGKSTFIRQIALLSLMTQIGSFIPVKEATMGVVDRIFARVGASDELTRGQSTFMVEMIETARILNGATSKSLVILDEIGRGTSTYDGISLAWAIVEYLHEKIGCRTFFATHYHELTDLADVYSGINNLNVAVREWDEEIAFLHKIVPGAADKSYGIHVARLAGVPREVVLRSRAILDELEKSHVDISQDVVRQTLQNASFSRSNSIFEYLVQNDSESISNDPHFSNKNKGIPKTKADNHQELALGNRPKQRTASGSIQFSLFGPDDHPVVEELRNLELNQMTPFDALLLLQQWKNVILEKDHEKRK